VPLYDANEEIDINLFREIKVLQQMDKHQNIVELLDVFVHGSCFVLVFELMYVDLASLIRFYKVQLSESQVKTYSLMIFKGIDYVHSLNIIHRDLKPSNLLLTPKGILKIADFGLARISQKKLSDKRTYSHQVATRWYRSPELLYGARKYGNGVDYWAIGCIMAEMINFSPLFKGENDIDQLCTVLHTMGTPTIKEWPEMINLPDYNKISFMESKGVPMHVLIPEASDKLIHLIQNLLKYNPKHRLNSSEALIHPCFFSIPIPETMQNMETPLNHCKMEKQRKDSKNKNRQELFEFDVEEPIKNLNEL
ncbi:Cell cycle-related kinase, partial [Intoshia linei]